MNYARINYYSKLHTIHNIYKALFVINTQKNGLNLIFSVKFIELTG